MEIDVEVQAALPDLPGQDFLPLSRINPKEAAAFKLGYVKASVEYFKILQEKS